MRLVSAVAALLRRLRSERAVTVLMFGLVAMTSFAVAAGPRLFNRVADEGLRYEAERATVAQRNIQFSRVDRVSAGTDDPFERVVVRGATLRGQVAESIVELIDENRFVVDFDPVPASRAAQLPDVRDPSSAGRPRGQGRPPRGPLAGGVAAPRPRSRGAAAVRDRRFARNRRGHAGGDRRHVRHASRRRGPAGQEPIPATHDRDRTRDRRHVRRP